MRPTGGLVAGCALVAALAGACAPLEAPRAPDPLPAEPVAAAAPSVEPPPPDVSRTTHVAVLDPAALASLERGGFALGMLALGTDARTTEELARTDLSSVFQALESDVRAAVGEHPTARVSSVQGARLFDVRWLRSPEMRFELVGVFNRLDRRAHHVGSCGEVRFLHRLAFTRPQGGVAMHGRLPLLVNVVFTVPDTIGCEAVARAWRAPADLDAGGAAAWLTTEGALRAASRETWKLHAVETNLQTVRIQSTAHPTMGGHVEYSLRVFHPKEGGERSFEPAPMENMPDLTRLNGDPALRQELVAHLREPEVLAAIDEGTVRLPDRFLATKARSIAPRGLSRAGNRPFRQLLKEADLEGLDLSSYRTIRSKSALLRRLDGLSCVGCHQSGSIAGFHHVGLDAATDPAWSSLVSGASTHLQADLERRHRYVDAVADGEPTDNHRPPAERQGRAGVFGAPCGLGDPGFAEWTCATGLKCAKLEDPEVGMCVDDQPVGAPCETGERLFDGTTPVRDRVAALSRRSCGEDLGCSPNINGFPLGACAGGCEDATSSAACIDFIDIDGLQACLRAGYEASECASRFAVERVDRACDAAHPCRQDFVCARTDDPARGACVPPYFVYPLRLDGYPMKN